MANKITRAWFVDKLLRIGIVEKATNAVTKDGYTSNWKSVSELGCVFDFYWYSEIFF